MVHLKETRPMLVVVVVVFVFDSVSVVVVVRFDESSWLLNEVGQR